MSLRLSGQNSCDLIVSRNGAQKNRQYASTHHWTIGLSFFLSFFLFSLFVLEFPGFVCKSWHFNTSLREKNIWLRFSLITWVLPFTCSHPDRYQHSSNISFLFYDFFFQILLPRNINFSIWEVWVIIFQILILLNSNKAHIIFHWECLQKCVGRLTRIPT